MRIKAWAITGAGAVLAGSALGIVVATNDPSTAEPVIHWLFWASAGLACLGVCVTLLLLDRMNLAQATWVGVTLTAGMFGAITVWRIGYQGGRLLGVIVFATLSISFFLWHRYRG